MSVTANGSAHQGLPVTCHGCEHNGNELSNRSWISGTQLHCTTCHEDGHRACAQCTACLPPRHRWDRIYCSTSCRVRAHKVRELARLERVIWEGTHPEEAAKERAEKEAWLEALVSASTAMDGGPRVRERRRRHADLKARADRCAECDKPFEDEDIIYRRALHGSFGPVLPYCGDHRCTSSDGHHNKDAPEGRHYPGCRCPGTYGDRKWWKPEPCAFCGREVCNDRETADPHKFVRQWAWQGEVNPPTARTFCSDGCRRSFCRAKAKRDAEHSTRQCEMCREQFTASRQDACYCSNACRQRAYRKRKVPA